MEGGTVVESKLRRAGRRVRRRPYHRRDATDPPGQSFCRRRKPYRRSGGKGKLSRGVERSGNGKATRVSRMYRVMNCRAVLKRKTTGRYWRKDKL